jgi:hypothetical protein
LSIRWCQFFCFVVSRPKLSLILAYCAQAILAIVFAVLHFQIGGEGPDARLSDLTNFATAAPCSHRVLVPALINVTHSILPLSYFRLYQASEALFAFLAMFIFSRYLAASFDRAKTSWLALLLLYPMAFNYLILGDYISPWDIPAIFFFLLGLLNIQRGRYLQLVVVVILATMNRETSFMLVLSYALLNLGQMQFSLLLKRTSLLATVWLVCKVALTMLTWERGGNLYWNVAPANLAQLRGLITGDVPTILWALSLFGGLHLVVLFLFRRLPSNIKRLSLIVPFMFAVMFFTSFYTEERIFNELVPFFALATILAIFLPVKNEQVQTAAKSLRTA